MRQLLEQAPQAPHASHSSHASHTRQATTFRSSKIDNTEDKKQPQLAM